MSPRINLAIHGVCGVLIALLLGSYGCVKPYYSHGWLEDPLSPEPSLSDPTYRVSSRISTPSMAQKKQPIVIACHGFAATTYEWAEFKDVAEKRGLLVSLVLLGGHGRSFSDFSASTWTLWNQPILEEYQALVQKGYTNLHILTASASAPLILEDLKNHAFDHVPPKTIIMVDPFIIPKNKLLYAVNWIGLLIGTHRFTHKSEEERRHWYSNAGYKPMTELKSLITQAARDVKKGIPLPQGTSVWLYQGLGDELSDPQGALFIQTGLWKANPNHLIGLTMLPSSQHVFVRKNGRQKWTNFEDNMRNQALDLIIRSEKK